MTRKFKLVFEDRLGIVADVSRVLADLGANIAAMEVSRRGAKAHLHMEIENCPADLAASLAGLPGLEGVEPLTALPLEEREQRLRVVFDTIRQGVVAVDVRGRVASINKPAAAMLGCGLDVVGVHVRDLGLPEEALPDRLAGKAASPPRRLLAGAGRFFLTARPILDSAGNVMGAVLITHDPGEVKRLAQSIADQEPTAFADIVGRHPALRNALALAEKAAGAEASVCVLGESGSGKELFARAIHTASGRKGAFVAVNCAALPEQLLESELFGYAPGAFTGAQKTGKPGLFELASGGTLFFDEIAELPPACQAKILRVLQERRARRLGGTAEIPVDVRVVAAANRDLARMVRDKLFRQDLYYRLSVLSVHVPPLRERAADIPLLAEHFLSGLESRLDRVGHSLSPGAMDKLMSHPWPGNVRELKNVIERAVILCEGRLVGPEDVVFGQEARQRIRLEAEEGEPAERPLRETLDGYERLLVKKALDASKSVRAAARRLGLSHPALLAKMRKHDLRKE